MERNEFRRMLALKAERDKANNQQQQQPQEEQQKLEMDPENESASELQNLVSYISCLCCIR